MMLSYAMDFVSYLLTEGYLESYNLRNIILYGSVARGDFTKDSDIDIFIDIDADKKFKEKLKNTVHNFYGSVWHRNWERFAITNQINCLAGRLEEWKDLERSIISNGIVLYGSYKPEINGKVMTLFYIEGVKPESRRVFINRKLFGYKRYGKKISGLMQELNGEKIGKGCFMIPIESSQKMLQFLRKNKVKTTIREINLI